MGVSPLPVRAVHTVSGIQPAGKSLWPSCTWGDCCCVEYSLSHPFFSGSSYTTKQEKQNHITWWVTSNGVKFNCPVPFSFTTTTTNTGWVSATAMPTPLSFLFHYTSTSHSSHRQNEDASEAQNSLSPYTGGPLQCLIFCWRLLWLEPANVHTLAWLTYLAFSQEWLKSKQLLKTLPDCCIT